MDKQAFYRYAGRDLALRAITEGTIDDMSKTASQGGQVSGQAYNEVNDYAHSIDYVDELQKIAEARGMAQAYNSVLQELGNLETADDLDLDLEGDVGDLDAEGDVDIDAGTEPDET